MTQITACLALTQGCGHNHTTLPTAGLSSLPSLLKRFLCKVDVMLPHYALGWRGECTDEPRYHKTANKLSSLVTSTEHCCDGLSTDMVQIHYLDKLYTVKVIKFNNQESDPR